MRHGAGEHPRRAAAGDRGCDPRGLGQLQRERRRHLWQRRQRRLDRRLQRRASLRGRPAVRSPARSRRRRPSRRRRSTHRTSRTSRTSTTTRRTTTSTTSRTAATSTPPSRSGGGVAGDTGGGDLVGATGRSVAGISEPGGGDITGATGDNAAAVSGEGGVGTLNTGTNTGVLGDHNVGSATGAGAVASGAAEGSTSALGFPGSVNLGSAEGSATSLGGPAAGGGYAEGGGDAPGGIAGANRGRRRRPDLRRRWHQRRRRPGGELADQHRRAGRQRDPERPQRRVGGCELQRGCRPGRARHRWPDHRRLRHRSSATGAGPRDGDTGHQRAPRGRVRGPGAGRRRPRGPGRTSTPEPRHRSGGQGGPRRDRRGRWGARGDGAVAAAPVDGIPGDDLSNGALARSSTSALQAASAYGRPDLAARLSAARRRASPIPRCGSWSSASSSRARARSSTRSCSRRLPGRRRRRHRGADGRPVRRRTARPRWSTSPRAAATPTRADRPVHGSADYASEAGNPGNAAAGAIRRGIGVPSPVLAGGLVLVDTPGVGGLGSVHSAITMAALPMADAVLFVTDASQELTGAGARLPAPRGASCARTWSWCSPRSTSTRSGAGSCEIDRGRLARRRASRSDVLPVSSALQRLSPSAPGATELAAESGFPELVAYLRRRRGRRRRAPRGVGRRRTTCSRSPTSSTSMFRTERAALEDPEKVAAMIAELEAAKARADELKSRAAARWQVTLGDGIADLNGRRRLRPADPDPRDHP